MSHGSVTPVTDALKGIGDVPAATLKAAIPETIVDVLTAHPVDMDRGLLVTHKQRFEALCREWQRLKRSYDRIKDWDERLAIRAALNDAHRRLRNRILLLLNTPNYRAVQIKPESEQRARYLSVLLAPCLMRIRRILGIILSCPVIFSLLRILRRLIFLDRLKRPRPHRRLWLGFGPLIAAVRN